MFNKRFVEQSDWSEFITHSTTSRPVKLVGDYVQTIAQERILLWPRASTEQQTPPLLTNSLLYTQCIRNLELTSLDRMLISASTQSGQSRSPQKRNFCEYKQTKQASLRCLPHPYAITVENTIFGWPTHHFGRLLLVLIMTPPTWFDQFQIMWHSLASWVGGAGCSLRASCHTVLNLVIMWPCPVERQLWRCLSWKLSTDFHMSFLCWWVCGCPQQCKSQRLRVSCLRRVR